MTECPELRDIAHYVEFGEGTRDLVKHLATCDACQEARDNLEDEAMSLQISISELWFREQVSCPDDGTLQAYAGKGLGDELRAYVAFHLDTLQCRTCQARLAELEIARSAEAKDRAGQSRAKVADATSKLLMSLRKNSR
jgi:hypothetical protein